MRLLSPGRHHLLLVAVLLVWCALAAGVSSAGTHAAAGTQAVPVAHATAGRALDPVDTHLATIRQAYDDLLDAFYQPVTPSDVIGPALDSVLEALAEAGQGVPARAQLPADREGAFQAFAGYYRQLAAVVSDGDAQQAAFLAISAMFDGLNDDHTGFLPPSAAPIAMDPMDPTPLVNSGSRGSGMLLGAGPMDAQPFVAEVAPAGPADQAGVRPGDVVLAVNGTAVSRADRFAAVRPLFAPAGSVMLHLSRPGSGELDVTITLGVYSFPVWSGTVLPDGTGLMRLRAFVDPWRPLADGRTIMEQVDATLDQFEAAGVQRWVLDLREDPGGSGLTVEALTGRFVADALLDRQFDERGRVAQDLTDGNLFRVQRPLALLVNGGSASASELTASLLKESGRAVLVGQRTAGALGNAAIWLLGEDATAEIAFAELHSGQDALIDHVGIAVDRPAPARTGADYAAGRDPQLDAAIAALQDAAMPAQPPALNTLVPLGRAAVQQRLLPLQPSAATLSAAGLTGVRDLGSYMLTSYNDYNNWATATAQTSGSGGGRDAIATRELARSRGWLGGRVAVYSSDPRGAALWASWDLYIDAAGADAALAANDFPDQWEPLLPPGRFGDGATNAKRGLWGDLGTLQVRWRRGNIVLTAEFQGSPGQESIAAWTAFAQQLDQSATAAAP